MERAGLLNEQVDAIRALRALGAVRVRVGDMEATFAAPDLVAVEETPEERQKRVAAERESLLFHSAAE